MGVIWSKIRGGKKSTAEKLEKISKQIKDIEDFKRDTQAWQKKLIGHLLAYFICFYVMAVSYAYFRLLHHPDWQSPTARLQLLSPFLVAPVIIFLLRHVLTWWYHRKLRRNESQLEDLRQIKAKILEEVMENETYKVAKDILDKYDSSVGGGDSKSPRTLSTPATDETIARRRLVPRKVEGMGTGGKPTPRQSPAFSPAPTIQQRAPGPPLPRPVLARERGYLDRVVEYLVGDGTSNRYALICQQCQSHNGMALREEFEYIAYRCCYCFYWNPARKQKPSAPKLPSAVEQPSNDSSESSSSESDGKKPSEPL